MNINKAASILGQKARGKPKHYKPAELARRRARMVAMNKKRSKHANPA